MKDQGDKMHMILVQYKFVDNYGKVDYYWWRHKTKTSDHVPELNEVFSQSNFGKIES